MGKKITEKYISEPVYRSSDVPIKYDCFQLFTHVIIIVKITGKNA
jgi:hypothetical protein